MVLGDPKPLKKHSLFLRCFANCVICSTCFWCASWLKAQKCCKNKSKSTCFNAKFVNCSSILVDLPLNWGSVLGPKMGKRNLDFRFHFGALFLMPKMDPKTGKNEMKTCPLVELLFRSTSRGVWPRNAVNCNTKTSSLVQNMNENNSAKPTNWTPKRSQKSTNTRSQK